MRPMTRTTSGAPIAALVALLGMVLAAGCDGSLSRGDPNEDVAPFGNGHSCGNGVCQPKESCHSCPQDCGRCAGDDARVVSGDSATAAADGGTATADGSTSTVDGGAIAADSAPSSTDSTSAGTDGTVSPPTGATNGIWISAAELAKRPMSGAAWKHVKDTADSSLGAADLYDQDSRHPLQTMAVALVYARTGQTSYRKKAADAVISIITSSSQGRSLGLGRNLAAYVIAADLVDLAGYDATKDAKFRDFLKKVRFWKNLEGRTLVQCHEVRPNNWGTMCGASRIAADLYLGDKTDLASAVEVYKGFIGDRSAYAKFKFGSDAFSWMCDTSNPRPLNPAGCKKDGHDLSGAAVDDVRRGGTYTWPPNATHYAWGGFSAAAAQAELLYRAGYDAYNWQDKAILRGMKFLATAMASSESNATEWLPWLVNYRYKTSFSTQLPVGRGRLISFTDWTHGK